MDPVWTRCKYYWSLLNNRTELLKITSISSKIIGLLTPKQPALTHTAATHRALTIAHVLVHPLDQCFTLLPSGRSYTQPICSYEDFKLPGDTVIFLCWCIVPLCLDLVLTVIDWLKCLKVAICKITRLLGGAGYQPNVSVFDEAQSVDIWWPKKTVSQNAPSIEKNKAWLLIWSHMV